MNVEPWAMGQEVPATLQPPVGAAKVVRLWNKCPWSGEVTDYDRRNLYIYGWLLDGNCAGVPEREMARVIFGIDADRHPARAALVVRSHLERARWLQDGEIPFLNW